MVKMKELEEAREQEKSKWQTFNAKVYFHLIYALLVKKKLTTFLRFLGFKNQERRNS